MTTIQLCTLANPHDPHTWRGWGGTDSKPRYCPGKIPERPPVNQINLDASGPHLRIFNHGQEPFQVTIAKQATRYAAAPVAQPITIPSRVWIDLPIELPGNFVITEDLGTTLEATDTIEVGGFTGNLLDVYWRGVRTGIEMAKRLAAHGASAQQLSDLNAVLDQANVEIGR